MHSMQKPIQMEYKSLAKANKNILKQLKTFFLGDYPSFICKQKPAPGNFNIYGRLVFKK